MHWQTWSAFVVAATILVVIPGPTVLLVIGQAIAHGRRAVMPLVVGVTLGDFTALTFSLLGLGALLAASAVLFSVLKWIGAAYLVYIGIRHWLESEPARELPDGTAATEPATLFRRAYVVTALNPKSILFFIAFLPQFVRPPSPAFPQFLLLGATFLFLASVNTTLYAIFAGHLRDVMKNTTVHRWLQRCGGSVLIAAGVFTAAMHRG